MRSVSSSTARACSTTAAPIVVGLTALGLRSKSDTPSVRSSFMIWAESVGCVTWQRAAARPKWRSSASATA